MIIIKYFLTKRAKHERLRAKYSRYWKGFYGYLFEKRKYQLEKQYFHKIAELQKSESDLVKKMSIFESRKSEADKLIGDLRADLSRMDQAVEQITAGLQTYLAVKGRIENYEKRLRGL